MPSISIHTPAKGVTHVDGFPKKLKQISIHTPAKGVTPGAKRPTHLHLHFNPHPREGGDPVKHGNWIFEVKISIHTPAKGVTYHIYYPVPFTYKFQSTPPRRG